MASAEIIDGNLEIVFMQPAKISPAFFSRTMVRSVISNT